MRVLGGSITLSPSDLSGFLGCRHRTGLDLAAAHGVLPAPERTDAFVTRLRTRGAEHEARYVAWLRGQGLNVVALRMDDPPERTVEAMRRGAPIVVQANLAAHGWSAFADVLRRVERPSALGEWSYEALDTKLARETRGATILQLSAYSDLLTAIQGLTPEHFYVVAPGTDDGAAFVEHRYRVSDFAAFYRVMRAGLLETVAAGHEAIVTAHYPEPVPLCDVCRWLERCTRMRRRDDHLSFVAGAGRLQRAELGAHAVTTLAGAAAMPLPVPFTPARGSRDTYARIREQARLQHEQRTSRQPRWELLPGWAESSTDAAYGLRRLPAPSPGDLFLDIEGARFVREGGREYLFGLRHADGTHDVWWAFDDLAEKQAFEAVVDRIMAAWTADDQMHVYHFGHYEQTAFKQLMGRHATRADEIDRLLRAGRFVDLHAIVRQSLRAGVERYSLKQLEQYYRFTRRVALGDAVEHLAAVELALETDAASLLDEDALATVRGYNDDDCRSAAALRDWLETIRADVEAAGTPVPRPVPAEGAASDKVSALQAEVDGLRARLLDGIAVDPGERDEAGHARWLLAYLIDWHRRADKAEWWEFYRLCELGEEELLEERRAVAGLELVARGERILSKKGMLAGPVTDRYRYPEQDIEIAAGDELKRQDGSKLGDVKAIDRAARTIDITKSRTAVELHPRAAFAHRYIDPSEMQRAIMRLAEALLSQTAESGGHCGLDLLHRARPRLTRERFVRSAAESELDFAVRLVTDLDATTLAIQGPPGAGKTYTGAQMIRALVRAGKRVGVTANSHKVIRNLLDEVLAQCDRHGEVARVGHKVGSGDARAASVVVEFEDNKTACAAIAAGDVQVLGGTPFLWARAELAASVDVLFVDEAGQMALANALAVSQAARSLVLLGDPQQLEQPQKGVHPDGVNASALDHVLGGAKTMPDDRGLFLPVTWRLAPAICTFTSEVFYESKLQPRPGLERQRLTASGGFDGAGLWLVPVAHDGNQQSSMEEVAAIDRIVTRLLAGGRWVNRDDVEAPLGVESFRIVAPYNAQVNRLLERLGPRGVPVGTVDKFQGQEAPVVIYSMATSRAEDAPRGMEFLYSANRLNVATSRARCAVILVASPRLFEPECRTPAQMQLANALCRYRELATVVDVVHADVSDRPRTRCNENGRPGVVPDRPSIARFEGPPRGGP